MRGARMRMVAFDSCGRRPDTTSRSRGAGGARNYKSRVPSRKQRAQGRPGAITPAVVRKNAHGGPQVRRNTRPSLRDGFTAYAAISPEPNSSGLRRRRIGGSHRPVGRSQTFAGLTPATGARTTRFCRPQLPRAIRSNRPACCRKKFRPRRLSAVRLTCRPVAHGHNRPATTRAPDTAASTATRPNVRDDGQRPSWRDRMAGVVDLIWVAR